jgi:hypothetical protein
MPQADSTRAGSAHVDWSCTPRHSGDLEIGTYAAHGGVDDTPHVHHLVDVVHNLPGGILGAGERPVCRNRGIGWAHPPRAAVVAHNAERE